MVKQPDFWTNTLMIASGLPRLSSRHHWVSGSTTASTPIGRAQRGICCVALVCILRDWLALVLLVWAAAGAAMTMQRGRSGRGESQVDA